MTLASSNRIRNRTLESNDEKSEVIISVGDEILGALASIADDARHTPWSI
jgi:hypothetical protein